MQWCINATSLATWIVSRLCETLSGQRKIIDSEQCKQLDHPCTTLREVEPTTMILPSQVMTVIAPAAAANLSVETRILAHLAAIAMQWNAALSKIDAYVAVFAQM